MGSITQNFDVADFQCHCVECGADHFRPFTKVDLVKDLQTLRDRVGKPLVISCGVRCPAHNQAVGGAKDSRHLPMYCDAVDVAVSDSQERYFLVKEAIEMDTFTCIEVCGQHVHLDHRPGRKILLIGHGP